MFDFHLHTKVSFDGKSTATEMLHAAAAAGLKEICFTDHLDYDPRGMLVGGAFETEVYNAAYDDLHHDNIVIRRGMEFGMLTDNRETLSADLQRRHFDFVIGSVHFVDDIDIYFEEFWQNKTIQQAEMRCLEQTLECVKAHDGFDVLGHLTYPSKCPGNPNTLPILYNNYREIVDEILKTLIAKGKGIEVNTSGVDSCGVYLPDAEYVRRFKELGGEIVTVGSDAHHTDRVGQYCMDACRMVADVFGYVCTFADRKPVFHKL